MVLNHSQDTEGFYLIRYIHANGAREFFFLIYFHLFRGLFFQRFHNKEVWFRGVILLMLLIASAFLGYVLPYGNIRLWGATVITNLLRVVPIVGQKMVYLIWGDFCVGTPTLSFFFSLHFIMPIILIVFTVVHINLLHLKGSRALINQNMLIKTTFEAVFLVKDILNLTLIFTFLMFLLEAPNSLGERDNWLEANQMSSPLHIQPEWYFLFAYAMLRAVPNKTGGVLALGFSLLSFLILPFKLTLKIKTRQITTCVFIVVFLGLTFLGTLPAEYPFTGVSLIFTWAYFLLLLGV